MSDAHAGKPVQAAPAGARDVRGRIDALVAAGELDGALRAIEHLVEEVICEPLNTAEIFADAFLDHACQRIGAACLRAMPPPPAPMQADTDTPIVFVASRLQSSGGHTAVLADIARLCGRPVRILLTGVSGRTEPRRLSHLLGEVPDLRFETAPRGSRLARLKWLQGRVRALRPDTVWLFNHHQDSVAVAAVQPGQGYELKYLHHGDHHLCLGVWLPFGEHHDPHPMGWHNCREVLGRRDNRYLPMAIASPELAVASGPARIGPLVTCTAAGRNKIEHDYWPGYAEVIAGLLARTGGIHLHVGRLTLAYRWRIRRALARNGVARQAFRYVPYVRSVAATLQQEQVDVYVSSFPYPGARTLVEAMAAAVPVAIHDHSGSRFLGALDMAPPGSCVWSRPDQLFSFVETTDRMTLTQLGALARARYDSYHSPQAMRDALAPGASPAELPPRQFPHCADPLAQAIRRARAFSVRGLLMRRLLRMARRARSALS